MQRSMCSVTIFSIGNKTYGIACSYSSLLLSCALEIGYKFIYVQGVHLTRDIFTKHTILTR